MILSKPESASRVSIMGTLENIYRCGALSISLFYFLDFASRKFVKTVEILCGQLKN